jgi:hypothetical protein
VDGDEGIGWLVLLVVGLALVVLLWAVYGL